MKCLALLGLLGVTALAGCTHHQLTDSTVHTTSTVLDIQYRIVLTNLAMMSCHPKALPAHIDLADGVIQVNDRAGLGASGGLTALAGDFGIERFGPDAQRQVTEQWGADATTDPQRLTELQDLYRVALGLPPLPPPHAIAYLRQLQARKDAPGKEESKDRRNPREKGEGKPGGEEQGTLVGKNPTWGLRTLNAGDQGDAPSAASSGGGGSTPSGNGSSNGNGERRVPIDILLTDVPPPGWFNVGGKHDVPKNACYVGRFGDRYAWVTPEGVPSLARFTVTVLSVVKFDPGEPRRSRGLAVTR